MKLQMALDLDDMQKALQMASSTRDFVDIIEIGTPLIVRFGVDAVKMMKDSFLGSCRYQDSRWWLYGSEIRV